MNHRISRDGIEGVDDINYFLTLLMSFTVGSLVSLLIFTRFIHWVIPMFGSLTIMLCLDLNKRKRRTGREGGGCHRGSGKRRPLPV